MAERIVSNIYRCFVYGLFDPRDQTCFYVGMTARGAVEPESYIKSAHRGDTAQLVRRYLRRLHKRGFKATWEVLEECTPDNVWDVEVFWIASLRAAGAILTNVKDGGVGGGLGYRHSLESRRLIGIKSSLKVMSPESRTAISKANLGKPKSEETRRKLRVPRPGSGKRKGDKLRPETRARMALEGKQIGRKKSERVDVTCANVDCAKVFALSVNDRRLKNGSIFCCVPCYKIGTRRGLAVRGSKGG